MPENYANIDDVLSAIRDSLRTISHSEVDAKFSKDEHEALKNLIAYASDVTEFEALLKQIVGELEVDSDRLSRYQMYDHIYRIIPICKRAVKVYISQVCQKDPITGTDFLVKEVSSDEEMVTRAKSITENIMRSLKIMKRFREIDIMYLLRRGDCFTEVIPLTKVVISRNLDQQPIQEDYIQDFVRRAKTGKVDDYDLNKMESMLFDFYIGEDVTYSPILEQLDDTLIQEAKKNEEISISSSILLRSLKPESVFVLYNSYGSILGYLEIVPPQASQSAAGLVSQLGGMVTGQSGNRTEQLYYNLSERIIERIFDKIGQNTNVSEKDIDAEIRRQLKDRLYLTFKSLFVDVSLNRIMKRGYVRYIPPNRIAWAKIPSIDYYPYGESILDAMVAPARMYLLTLLSNLVIKLSRSSIVRKWLVEVGGRISESELVQKVKRDAKNKITVSDIGNFSVLPRILTEFKDMILLQKQGQRYVDIEFEPLGDPNIKVQDLEDLRRELISSSGIPAPYLGFIDVVELREQLVHANVTFANTISDIQSYVNDYLTHLVSIIATYAYPNDKVAQNGIANYVQVTLLPPVVLTLQLVEMLISSVGNFSSVLNGLGLRVDPYYFLKKYVPYIDWEELKKSGMKYDAEKAYKGQQSSERQGSPF